MFERLVEIIREYLDEKDIVITKETDILKDLKINSLDLVNFVCALEDEFKIEIPDRDIRILITVGDVLKYIENCAISK